jgi:MarR family transcriptional regulator, organic hydroperoxide resistance regulator
VTKGTLTGVLKTLEKRGPARRRGHDEDGRLVLVSLEPKGREVIERLFPAFNAGEAQVSASLLRRIIRTVEEEDRARHATGPMERRAGWRMGGGSPEAG